MATSNIICRYHKEGICANGRRCKFSHDLENNQLSRAPGSIPIQCKYYQQKACTLGKKCAYLHGRPPQPPITRVTPPSTVQQPPVAAAARPAPAHPAPAAARRAPQPSAEAAIDAMWGFDDSVHGDGGYYYGAPGGFVDETQMPAFSYRDALGDVALEEDPWQVPDESEAPRRTKSDRICIYHAQGVCRFGVLCKHMHDIPADLLDSPDRTPEERFRLDEEERELSAVAECGICYEPVREQFGLLNNCTHAFCLSCMRDWRSKGREHTHKEVVRLCPVCRTESFVVIPSARLVVDPIRKAKLVDMYKSTLSTIKCRYFEYGQTSCPFGSSCFYAHLMPDGSVAEQPKLRHAVGEGGTRIVTAPRLLDFLDSRP